MLNIFAESVLSFWSIVVANIYFIRGRRLTKINVLHDIMA